MNRLLTCIIFFLLPYCTRAQETVVKNEKLTQALKESVSVLKSDRNVRDGVYKAIVKENDKALAIGKYTKNVKTGIWIFYDAEGNPTQRYDFTHRKLLYEAVEDTNSNCRYVLDDTLKQNDRVTKPVRIGDRYYGYINYLKAFKLPPDLSGIDLEGITPVLELLVSPGGRLADFTVHLTSVFYNRKITLNLDVLNDEDKTFIPATLNGNPVSCRILMQCVLRSNGKLDIN